MGMWRFCETDFSDLFINDLSRAALAKALASLVLLASVGPARML